MTQWIQQTLSADTINAAVLLAAFLLGLTGALTSSTCSVAILAAVTGFSATLDNSAKRKNTFIMISFFILGTALALVTLGAVTALLSQAIVATLGAWWKLFAGFVIIFFGMAVLNLLPLTLPKLTAPSAIPKSKTGAMVFGLAIGAGLSAFCSGCNPSLFVALSMTTLQQNFILGTLLMTVYALGYSLALAIIIALLSTGIGKVTKVFTKLAPIIKVTAGILLLTAGFYLLMGL